MILLLLGTQVVTFVVDMEEDELEEVKDKIPIDRMKVTSSADILKGLNIGSYSSTVMTLDMKDLKYTEYPFNINEYYKNVPKLNTDATLPAYYEGFKKGTAATRIMSKIVDTALFTAGTYSKDFTKQISQSALREKLFYNKMVEIDYIGEINLTVGDVVRLETFKGRDKKLDTQNSGKYVIGRVEREFTSSRDSMSTKLTLFTDSSRCRIMMLEATANFIGKDGFNWWVGQVENTGGTKQKDADYTNKVKVRIVGYHNPSKKELPTEDLPWAMVAFPATQPQRGWCWY